MKVKVEQVISFLEEILGDYRKDSSLQYLFYCPKCKHRKQKLSINIKKMVFKCWICEYSGSIKKLVRDTNYNKVTNWINLVGNKKQLDVPDREHRIIELPQEFKKFGDKFDFDGKKALTYLMERGLTKYDIARYNIGYVTMGRYKNRVIIPSYDKRGKLNFFIGRAFCDWMTQSYRNEHADKTKIIFNDLLVDWSEPIILVEGVFDAIVAGPNSIPLLGNSLSRESLLFKKICTSQPDVYIAVDAETEKDRVKSIKIMKMLYNNGINVHHVDVSPYKDVAECGKKEFREKMKESKRIEDNDQLFEMEMSL